MSLSNEQLFEFLEYDLGIDTSDIDTETPLFSGGIIDSFALVNLMTFIETQAKIRIAPMDVTLENLDTVQRVLNYVDRAHCMS
ncbi:acyl carrier protein [Arenibacterium sp. CAU 1754]